MSKNPTIGDIHERLSKSEPASTPTHVYDHDHRKVFSVERHGHLQAIRADLAAGRPVYIPKREAR